MVLVLVLVLVALVVMVVMVEVVVVGGIQRGGRRWGRAQYCSVSQAVPYPASEGAGAAARGPGGWC